jgi:hypothetical protein
LEQRALAMSLQPCGIMSAIRPISAPRALVLAQRRRHVETGAETPADRRRETGTAERLRRVRAPAPTQTPFSAPFAAQVLGQDEPATRIIPAYEPAPRPAIRPRLSLVA